MFHFHQHFMLSFSDRVKNCTHAITRLHWDHCGAELLIATSDGDIEIYGMIDQLMNKWQIVATGSLPGEPILSSCWLNMPRKVKYCKI